MNAAEQATSPESANKIAATVALFKRQFPKAKATLTPWMNDPEAQAWTDPDSIDFGFNLPPGQTLVQLRLQEQRLVGIEAACFGPLGDQRWWFSTVGDWTFTGNYPPAVGFQGLFKQICQELFLLFNGEVHSAAQDDAAPDEPTPERFMPDNPIQDETTQDLMGN
ncbi:MAG: hypothetical protein MH252_22525 [Thermosynechococcaceae cyanobacterium MS004]|nr:hypothetical protein [Thermosynechococcaceae cyanobacterium MS004]